MRPIKLAGGVAAMAAETLVVLAVGRERLWQARRTAARCRKTPRHRRWKKAPKPARRKRRPLPPTRPLAQDRRRPSKEHRSNHVAIFPDLVVQVVVTGPILAAAALIVLSTVGAGRRMGHADGPLRL